MNLKFKTLVSASQKVVRWRRSNHSHVLEECNIRDRIREAINSTRRWNRDYKNTDQSDADFTASYLRQQSKRDAPMAVFIQRSIGKRIRRRLPRLRSLPLTLEEFCQDVTWKDVLDAVESVLVKNQDFATRGLQRM
jgi:hypothetical protein